MKHNIFYTKILSFVYYHYTTNGYFIEQKQNYLYVFKYSSKQEYSNFFYYGQASSISEVLNLEAAEGFKEFILNNTWPELKRKDYLKAIFKTNLISNL